MCDLTNTHNLNFALIVDQKFSSETDATIWDYPGIKHFLQKFSKQILVLSYNIYITRFTDIFLGNYFWCKKNQVAAPLKMQKLFQMKTHLASLNLNI
jgi:hypothetical protein